MLKVGLQLFIQLLINLRYRGRHSRAGASGLCRRRLLQQAAPQLRNGAAGRPDVPAVQALLRYGAAVRTGPLYADSSSSPPAGSRLTCSTEKYWPSLLHSNLGQARARRHSGGTGEGGRYRARNRSLNHHPCQAGRQAPLPAEPAASH